LFIYIKIEDSCGNSQRTAHDYVVDTGYCWRGNFFLPFLLPGIFRPTFLVVFDFSNVQLGAFFQHMV